MKARASWIVALSLARVAAAPATPLDTLSGAGPWSALASDDVHGVATPSATGAVAIAWDYRHHAGYAGAARALPIDWPENFELVVPIRGSLAGNVLEIKLADAANENVWWVRKTQLVPSAEGTVLHIRRREVTFAWGPQADHTLRHTARLEVIVNARSGAPGAIEIGPIELTPKPVPAATPPPAEAIGVDGRHPLPDGTHAALPLRGPTVIDWGAPREIGGALIAWQDAGPHHYRLESSPDARDWTLLQTVRDAEAVDTLAFAATEDRYWRIVPEDDLDRAHALAALVPLDPSFGEDPNRRVTAIARQRPRGEYPRGWLEQTAWTLVGEPGGGDDTGLLSEDGAFEFAPGAPALEPWLAIDGTPHSWADAEHSVALVGGDLPLPSVTRRVGPLSLTIAATGTGRGDHTHQVLTYTLSNDDARAHTVELNLLLRPFQVNPPAQFLNVAGGWSPIRALAWAHGRLWPVTPTQAYVLTPDAPPDAVSLAPWDGSRPGGWTPPTLGTFPASGSHGSPEGLETGVLHYTRRVAAHGHTAITVCVDRSVAAESPPARPPCAAAAERAHVATLTRAWQTRLHRVTVDADAPLAHALRDAIRTAHAHLLISADGPWLRPGTRSYARSWIRDGAMMSAALLRLGEIEAPLNYLDAWAGIQYGSGKVPCCRDGRGADPVPENDSAGEFLFLAGQVLQYGGAPGRAHVARVWPQLQAAVAYLDAQRDETRAPGQPPEYAGVLPVSISHEGYSAKPMHALWDDIWGLRGYADAITIATQLGHPAAADAYRASRAAFSAAVQRALTRSMAAHGIDTVPGAFDLGDFDATSTTVALSPGTGGEDLPAAALERTFARYWQFFLDRRDGRLAWDVYTPYEWRNVGALVRLGQRERALTALAWFFAARRPGPWNQWPEVVTRDPAEVRFIGDLPHGWVASDFLRAALDLYAYDDSAHGTVVLGAGLPRDWLEGHGVTVTHLATPWGPLSYRARRVGARIEVSLSEVPAAPGGLVLDFPGVRDAAMAVVDGVRRPTEHGRLRLSQPAHHLYFESE